jgi:hypothetical protein
MQLGEVTEVRLSLGERTLGTEPLRLLPPCEATFGFTGRILYRLSCARHGVAGALTDGFHSLPRRTEHCASSEITRTETQAKETGHKESAVVLLHRLPPYICQISAIYVPDIGHRMPRVGSAIFAQFARVPPYSSRHDKAMGVQHVHHMVVAETVRSVFYERDRVSEKRDKVVHRERLADPHRVCRSGTLAAY